MSSVKERIEELEMILKPQHHSRYFWNTPPQVRKGLTDLLEIYKITKGRVNKETQKEIKNILEK